MRRVYADRIGRVVRRLGEAALDPALWPEVMENLSAAVGATGAVLFQSDVRTADVPRTSGADEMITNYFRDNWHMRDLRAERGVPQILSGHAAVTDQDLVTPEEMRREGYYNEMLLPYGFRWFAGIGFWAGPALWALCIQRADSEGPFEAEDKRLLAALSAPLTEAATLSTAVGRSVVSGAANALGLIGQPAIVLDRLGCVLDWNGAAENLFDDEVRIVNRRLVLRDTEAGRAVDALMGLFRTTADDAAVAMAPILVRRERNYPFLIRALPLPVAARSPFLGARVLLTLSLLAPARGVEPRDLVRLFGLTPAEARLAAMIAQGTPPGEAAEQFGVSRETVRNQLKAIFSKTDTHRQSELVALLSRLAPAD